jgi:hypothetical protein
MNPRSLPSSENQHRTRILVILLALAIVSGAQWTPIKLYFSGIEIMRLLDRLSILIAATFARGWATDVLIRSERLIRVRIVTDSKKVGIVQSALCRKTFRILKRREAPGPNQQ